MNYFDPAFSEPAPNWDSSGVSYGPKPGADLVIGRAEFGPATSAVRPSLSEITGAALELAEKIGIKPPSGSVTHVAQLHSEVTRLRAQLERANATADFLAASGDAVRAENEALRYGFYENAARGTISMTKDAIDKAPAGVRDWLKAFGVYDGVSKPTEPVSEPDKPSDPRSHILGRALDAPIHGNAPGYPPYDP